MKTIAYLSSQVPSTNYLANEGNYTIELVRRASKRLHYNTVELTGTVSWDILAAIAEADLVHLEYAATRSFEIALLSARQIGKPTCVSVLADSADTDHRLSDSLDLLTLADCILCPSQAIASRLGTNRPIKVLRGGVEVDLLTAEHATSERDCVVCLGSWLPDRDRHRLLNVLPPELSLVLCASADSRWLPRRVLDWFSGRRVQYLSAPTRQQLRALYRRALAVIYPAFSHSEYAPPTCSGFAVLEAMACGATVLCPPSGALRELIRDGETGYLTDSLDELLDRLRLVTSTPAIAARTGGNARRAVQRDYSSAVGAERLADVYRELLNDHHGIPARFVA